MNWHNLSHRICICPMRNYSLERCDLVWALRKIQSQNVQFNSIVFNTEKWKIERFGRTENVISGKERRLKARKKAKRRKIHFPVCNKRQCRLANLICDMNYEHRNAESLSNRYFSSFFRSHLAKGNCDAMEQWEERANEKKVRRKANAIAFVIATQRSSNAITRKCFHKSKHRITAIKSAGLGDKQTKDEQKREGKRTSKK